MASKFWLVNVLMAFRLLPTGQAQIMADLEQPIIKQALPSEVLKMPPMVSQPEEIKAAEADYELRQQTIEAAMAETIRSHLDRPAEERRDILLAWLDQQRPLLEAQVARSAAIDALYVRHCIVFPASPEPLALTPLHAELAALRRQHADDPEALRDAMSQWMEKNVSEFEQKIKKSPLKQALQSVVTITSSLSAKQATPASLIPIVQTPTGPFQALEQEFNHFMSSHPPPMPTGDGGVSLAAMEEWRNTISTGTAAWMEKLNFMRADETIKFEQKISHEIIPIKK